MENKHELSWGYIARIFFKIGMYSFGGWTTTALLLEKELKIDRKFIAAKQLNGAVAYAQILPGATQVAIVSNAGYKLRGVSGALTATACYLLPSIALITLFAIVYFRFADSSGIMTHMDGLIAALGGVILANAYNIGKRHASKCWLWLAVVVAFVAKFVLGINAVVIILAFGLVGLAYSMLVSRRGEHDR